MTQGVLPVRLHGVWAVYILWKEGCDHSVMPFLFLLVSFLAPILHFRDGNKTYKMKSWGLTCLLWSTGSEGVPTWFEENMLLDALG